MNNNTEPTSSSRLSNRDSYSLADSKRELKGKELVNIYLEKDLNSPQLSKEERHNLSDEDKEKLQDSKLHPKETFFIKLYQRKPGRILKPLGQTLSRGGLIATVAGLLSGIFVGVPGFVLALAGFGGMSIGENLEKKAKNKREGVKEDLKGRINKLPSSSLEHKRLIKLVNKWEQGEGNKSLLKIKFKILEAEIKYSKLEEKDKRLLLEKFAGRQITPARYKWLIKKFDLVKGFNDSGLKNMTNHLEVMLKNKENFYEYKKEIKKYVEPDKHNYSLGESFYEDLLSAVEVDGLEDFKEVIVQGRTEKLTGKEIWEGLVANIGKNREESKNDEEIIEQIQQSQMEIFKKIVESEE